jgi:hypothetical protein
VCNVRGAAFFLRIALPSQDIEIDVAVARRLGGAALESIPKATYTYALMLETLRRVVTGGPEWLEGLTDWGAIPDGEFVAELFNAYLDARTEFFDGLKKNQPERDAAGRRDAPGPVSDSRDRPVAERTEPPGSLPGAKAPVPPVPGVTRGLEERPRSGPAVPASRNITIERTAGPPAGGHGRDAQSRGPRSDSRR